MNNIKSLIKNYAKIFNFVVENRYSCCDTLERSIINEKIEMAEKLKKKRSFMFLFTLLSIIPSMLQYFMVSKTEGHFIYFSLALTLVLTVMIIFYTTDIKEEKDYIKRYTRHFKNGLFYSLREKQLKEIQQKVKEDKKLKLALLEYGKYYENNPEKRKQEQTKMERSLYNSLFYEAFSNERESEKETLKSFLELKLKNINDKKILIVN